MGKTLQPSAFVVHDALSFDVRFTTYNKNPMNIGEQCMAHDQPTFPDASTLLARATPSSDPNTASMRRITNDAGVPLSGLSGADPWVLLPLSVPPAPHTRHDKETTVHRTHRTDTYPVIRGCAVQSLQ